MVVELREDSTRPDKKRALLRRPPVLKDIPFPYIRFSGIEDGQA